MENKGLEILIIASWYPSESNPIYGSFIEEQALLLKSKGHQVTVLYPSLNGTFKDGLGKKSISIKRYSKNGLAIIEVQAFPVLPKMRQLSYQKLAKTALIELQKDGFLSSINIIHSHAMFMGGIIAEYLSNKTGIPFLHTEHTSGLINSPEQYTSRDILTIARVLNGAKKAFFVSQFAKEEMVNRYKLKEENSEVMSNIVADFFFEGNPAELPVYPFKYIVIGNLLPRKNITKLVEAFTQLLEEKPDSILTIAGEGEQKNILLKQISDLNIGQNINWLPRLNRIQVKREIMAHHILVSTSNLETFGLTVAEAGATGTPVVVTDSGGVRDIVTEQTGIITGHTVAELAKGMLQIQSNFSSYNGNEIQKAIKDRFHEEVIYESLLLFYLKQMSK